jgi:hypothetical protein
MSVVVLVCGNVFDGISDTLTGPAEILVEGSDRSSATWAIWWKAPSRFAASS